MAGGTSVPFSYSLTQGTEPSKGRICHRHHELPSPQMWDGDHPSRGSQDSPCPSVLLLAPCLKHTMLQRGKGDTAPTHVPSKRSYLTFGMLFPAPSRALARILFQENGTFMAMLFPLLSAPQLSPAGPWPVHPA